MRRALPASLVLHLGALGGAYLLFVGAAADDPNGVESMTVDLIPIVATTNVTPDQAEVEATTAQVSAGADTVEMAEAEPVETLEPVEADAPVPRQLEGVEAERPEEPSFAEPPPGDAETPVEEFVPEPVRERMEVAALEQPAVEPRPTPVEPTVPLESIEAESEAPTDLLTAAPVSETPVEAEMPVPVAEAEPVEPVEAVATARPETPVGEPTEPVEMAEPIDPIETEAVEKPIEMALAEPLLTDVELPELTNELELPPVPRPKSVTQSNVPTYPEPEAPKAEPKKKTRAADKPAETKSAEKPAQKKQQVANVGNGGKNQADSAAGRASGGKGKSRDAGNAEVSKYPGLVRQRINRNLPKNRGGRGEVVVAFLVAKGGQVSGVSVVRSSGNPGLDKAAVAAVKKAAPYPPIPEAAGRTTWDFTIPLDFR